MPIPCNLSMHLTKNLSPEIWKEFHDQKHREWLMLCRIRQFWKKIIIIHLTRFSWKILLILKFDCELNVAQIFIYSVCYLPVFGIRAVSRQQIYVLSIYCITYEIHRRNDSWAACLFEENSHIVQIAVSHKRLKWGNNGREW